MRVLVLGSSGLIGAPLVTHLRRAGHDVTEWDIVIDAAHDLTDVTNVPRARIAIDSSDFVLFLAFDVGGAKYITTPTLSFLHQNSLLMAKTRLVCLMQAISLRFEHDVEHGRPLRYFEASRRALHERPRWNLCSILERLRSSKV